jgi:hypothetical protein
MNEVNNWQKLTTLPKGVVKEQGRFKGEYNLKISYVDGTWFLEYVYTEMLYGDEEPSYPEIFSGHTLEDVVNKASNFFDANFGKYKLIG